MNKWKIQLFENEHSEPFPVYRSLSMEKCAAIKSAVANLVGKSAANSVEIMKSLEALAIDTGTDPCGECFSLQPWKQHFASSIYINWGSFDDIDEMSFDDLSGYFSDLWFRSSDDVEIFDDSFRSVLLVRHWCAVQIVHFN